jgi:hypothetical protein
MLLSKIKRAWNTTNHALRDSRGKEKLTRKENEASTQSHGKTKTYSHGYELLRHGHQIENKALTRMLMEGRLYHIKYDTLITEEG